MSVDKIDLLKVALKIKADFYKPVNTYKTTIFLCGADLKDRTKTRFKLAEALKRSWLESNWIDFVYPEDIFDDVLYSNKGMDLLSLENLLAESIDVILIVPESPGSFAELGAFANDSKLRQKMVCVVDQKYRKDKSFINQGPLKLVRAANDKGVLFIDPGNIGASVKEIHSAIKRVKKSSTKNNDKISMLQLENFLLPTIYLMEPLTRDGIVEMVKNVNQDTNNSFHFSMTALSSMTKKKLIELGDEGYKLTTLGIKHYYNLRSVNGRNKLQKEIVALDNMRLEILNSKLRNKKLKI